MNVLGNNGFRCWDERVSFVQPPLYREMDTTCALVQVKNCNFFASRFWNKVVVCVAED